MWIYWTKDAKYGAVIKEEKGWFVVVGVVMIPLVGKRKKQQIQVIALRLRLHIRDHETTDPFYYLLSRYVLCTLS